MALNVIKLYNISDNDEESQSIGKYVLIEQGVYEKIPFQKYLEFGHGYDEKYSQNFFLGFLWVLKIYAQQLHNNVFNRKKFENSIFFKQFKQI